MEDPLASPLLTAVLESRDAVALAEHRLLEARTDVWRAALAAGVPVRPPRFGERPPALTELVTHVATRIDPAADRLRTAHAELVAAEAAASSAHDVAAVVVRRFRESLAPGERDLDIGESLLRGGERVHRFDALLDVAGRAVRVARTARCGERRGLRWRTPKEKPEPFRLCDPCHGRPDVAPRTWPAPRPRWSLPLLGRRAWR